jgi:UDP-N-acetylmuramyl pentapeptide phosphotransferase/UDP-N-acetylglucosamine-1-phosphate transferase
LLDVPGSKPHKLHHSAVPIAGGIVIFSTVILVGDYWRSPAATRCLADPGACGDYLHFGLLDDAKGLSVLWKLSGQILATILLIQLGIQVLLFQSNWLNVLVTFLVDDWDHKRL